MSQPLNGENTNQPLSILIVLMKTEQKFFAWAAYLFMTKNSNVWQYSVQILSLVAEVLLEVNSWHQVRTKKQPAKEVRSKQYCTLGTVTAFYVLSNNLGLSQKKTYMVLSHSAGTYLGYLCLLFIAFPPSYLRGASGKEREGLLQVSATSRCGFLILIYWNLFFISHLQPVFSKSRKPSIYSLSLSTTNWIRKNAPILFFSKGLHFKSINWIQD